MNILVQLPNNVNDNDILRELSAILGVTTQNKPKEDIYLNSKTDGLKGSYTILKRNGGAIDYTIIVKEQLWP